MSTMRALRVVQKDPLPSSLSASSYHPHLTTLPIPSPSPSELLIKIRASSIQPSDILNSTGSFHHTTFPRTLGRDFSGVVVSGPPDLLHQPIFGTSGAHFSFTIDGAQAEYALLPIASAALKPSNLTFAQAASLGTPLTTANLMLLRTDLRATDRVLVLGANGAVGGYVVQIARARGCGSVVGVSRKGGEGMVSSEEDPKLEGVRERWGGKGPDVVVDAVGDMGLMKWAIAGMESEGRYVFISAPRGGESTVLGVDLLDFYRRRLALMGCNSAAEEQEKLAGMLRGLGREIEEGRIVVGGEEGLNLIGIEEGVEAYEKKARRTVIVFDE